MIIQEYFGYLLNLNARLIKRKLDTYLKEFDITTAQWAELKLLSVEDTLMQVEIADKLNADIATVGATTDRLVKKGLLRKKRLKEDRRAYGINITDKGKDIVNNLEEKVLECNRIALKGFSQEEITMLSELMNRVTTNLTREEPVGEREEL